MKWLITGGCGFIGTNLIRHLAAQGQTEIRIVDNLCGATPSFLPAFATVDYPPLAGIAERLDRPGVQLIVADILDQDLAIEACRGIDVVVHLAANTGVAASVADPRADCTCNVLGLLNYLEAARHNGVKRFVFASSGAPAGNCTPPVSEAVVPKPVSPYGASKLAGEGYCSAYHQTYGLETVALRFSNVYGPFSSHKTSVVAKFILAALEGRPLTIYGDGDQSRDFIFVTDLIGAIAKGAVAPGIGGEIFQIATGTETTVNELIDLLASPFGRHGLPLPEVVRTEPRLGDIRRNFADVTKARRMLDWQAATPPAEGLAQTVNWFVARHQRQDRR